MRCYDMDDGCMFIVVESTAERLKSFWSDHYVLNVDFYLACHPLVQSVEEIPSIDLWRIVRMV